MICPICNENAPLLQLPVTIVSGDTTYERISLDDEHNAICNRCLYRETIILEGLK